MTQKSSMPSYSLEDYILLLLDNCKNKSITEEYILERFSKTGIAVRPGCLEGSLMKLMRRGELAINGMGEYYSPSPSKIKHRDDLSMTTVLVQALDQRETMISKLGLITLMHESGQKFAEDLPESFYKLMDKGYIFEVKRQISDREHHLFGLVGKPYIRYDLIYSQWNDYNDG